MADNFGKRRGVSCNEQAQIIDDALPRTGRFDYFVDVPKLDCKVRLEILKVYIRTIPVNEANLEELSEKQRVSQKQILKPYIEKRSWTL